MPYRSSRETRAECRDAGREFGTVLAEICIAHADGLVTEWQQDAAAAVIVDRIAEWLAKFQAAGVVERDLRILKQSCRAGHNDRLAEHLARIRLAERERPAVFN